MANEEHLEILRQGVEVWNRWREENPNIQPDLIGAELPKANLSEMNLANVDFIRANLFNANLSHTNLRQAALGGASLILANLSFADLSVASLADADLRQANLQGAILNKTDLSKTLLRSACLDQADLSGAFLWRTVFVDVDLKQVKGLIEVQHGGPSSLGLDVIHQSQGHIPADFLRGVGVPDAFINYAAALIGKRYHSCFISYSTKDEAFVRHLHTDLQNAGVRCWFAPEDMKIGDKIRSRIDASIKIHDKLLLILSKNSLNSAWVESEVEKAFEEERQRNQTVLFPVRLDGAVMETGQAWAADIRRTRHIGDFSRWKDHEAYQQAFERLLRDLQAES
ncbi:MAG: toll/interleukin-1 receptor domain-containing protein [Chloroflexi bacterium]|nr:toll/interleukin-1 receptor domain-containing protein [Chloroflexota bacterium]NOG66456.1 toll/interleukin-1 receptor domain-containing protein [Chloroflexota bacterium]